MARISSQPSVALFGFIMAMASAMCCCALYIAGPAFLGTLELEFYDLRLKLRGARDPGNAVAVVAIDEKSIAEIGRFPWTRARMAGLVDRLSSDGARVISFDVTFSEPEWGLSGNEFARLSSLVSDDPSLSGFVTELRSGDYAFSESMLRRGNVILPIVPRVPKDQAGIEPVMPPAFVEDSALLASKGDERKYSYIRAEDCMPPTELLGTSAASLGHIYAYLEQDGGLRRDPAVVEADGLYYPSLGLATAIAYLGVDKQDAVLYFGEGVMLGDRMVPTDEHGLMLVNYYGPEGSFGYYSFTDVLNGRFKPGTFRDKAVLVGATALGVYDLRVTPFSANMPGVEKHAAVIANILNGDYLVWRESFKLVDLLVILGTGVLLGLLLPRLGVAYGAVMSFLTVALVWLACYVALDTYGMWLNMVYPALTVGMSYVLVASYSFIAEEMKSRSIKRVFASYVAPKVVDALVRNPEFAKLGGERKELTVMFSDVRGFTTFSESREPEEVVARLNEYMTAMTDVILKWDGTVDKFVGDEIMAFWGAPLPQEDHAERAVLCAVEMIGKLRQMQRQWLADGKAVLDMGIGINTGVMVVGNMGAEGKKMDYTLIGDNVNLGARIEGLTREYDTHILVTEFTYNKIISGMKPGGNGPIDAVKFRELGGVRVKGKEKTVSIFIVDA